MPLGVQNGRKGVEAVEEGSAVKGGAARFQVSVMVPAAPVMAVGEITKWASEKIGPWAWAGLAVLLIAGGFLYSRQPEERRAKIRAAMIPNATHATVTTAATVRLFTRERKI